MDRYFEGKTVICLVDLQILERTQNSVKVYEFSQVNGSDGGIKKMESEENINYKMQHTKIIIASKGSNMHDRKALESTRRQLIASIGNVL